MKTTATDSGEVRSRATIAISGASGFIGSALTEFLERRGNEVRRFVRRPARGKGEIAWDPQGGTIDASALEGVEAIINLAGEPLAQRWTDEVKRRIRDSRVNGTALIAKAIAEMTTKPRVFLSGSAIGIYGDRGEEILDENSSLGDDFLAGVCKDWEGATKPAEDVGVRVVHLRTSLVLGRGGGVLPKLLLPVRFGVGGKIGSGQQWMSWIDLSDYIDAIIFLIRNSTISGPVNLSSINPVTNREFANVAGRVLGRPSLFAVPSFAVRLMMGEMGDETVLASQRVLPRRLIEARFDFSYPTLESSLRRETTQSARSVGH